MKWSDAHPTKYWKATDLDGGSLILRIHSLKIEQFDTDGSKPILYFRGEDKGLVVNKTNGDVLAAAFGDDTRDWEGQEIELFAMPVQFQGKTVDGLRVRVPRKRGGSRDDDRRRDDRDRGRDDDRREARGRDDRDDDRRRDDDRDRDRVPVTSGKDLPGYGRGGGDKYPDKNRDDDRGRRPKLDDEIPF